MKAFIILAAMLLSTSLAWAQAKISPSGRFLIHQAAQNQSRAQEPVLAFVDLATPDAEATLAATPGVEVVAVRGSIALARFPLADAVAISELPAVRSLSFGQEAAPLMNEARKASFVNPVLQGTDLSQSYRGSGVILGMMDIGLDPNHINFYDYNLTANRITWFATINAAGAMTQYDTPAKIRAFTTDNPGGSHATHVAGIMGGAYNREGSVASISGDVAVVSDKNVPFYGVAPNAELNLCVGELFETNITLAAETILKRAQAAAKPCAFNLSIGSVLGPHDGTDAYNRYMNELGKDMIICIAAGNDGASPVSLQGNFADTPQIKTILSGDGSVYNGVVDIWNSTNTTFDLTFALIDPATGAVAWSVRIPTNMGGEKIFYLSNSSDKTPGATHSTAFDNAFTTTSDLYVSNEVNADNNRYMAQLQFDLIPEDDSKLVPAIFISGTSGSVNAYSQSGYGLVFSNTLNGAPASGYTAGNPTQSINNLAMAENIICVGAYIDRVKWGVLSKQITGYSNYSDSEIGEVAPFTSFGSGPYRALPDFCAPGMAIISSYNQYNVDMDNIGKSILSATATTSINAPAASTGTRSNSWAYMQGTSMACPFVTGSVALLLEADPALKVDKVRSLLTETCMARTGRTPDEQKQWGAGAVNIQDAMLRLFGNPSAIGSVLNDPARRLAIDLAHGSVVARVAGASALTARLYSTSGALAATATASADAVTLSTSGLPKGVYILRVTSPSGISESRSILVE